MEFATTLLKVFKVSCQQTNTLEFNWVQVTRTLAYFLSG